MTVCKYTDKATAFLKDRSDNEKMWQIQIEHECRPNVTSSLIDNMNKYLAHAKIEDTDMPGTVQELKEKYGIIVTITKDNDPYNVGFKQWQLAVYAVGDEDALANTLALLHDYMMW